MKQIAFKIHIVLVVLLPGVLVTSCELNSIEQPARVQEIPSTTPDINPIQPLLEPGQLDFFPKSMIAGSTHSVVLKTLLKPSPVLKENLVEFTACSGPGRCEKIAGKVTAVYFGAVNRIGVSVPEGATSGKITLKTDGKVETSSVSLTIVPATGLVAFYMFDGYPDDKTNNHLNGLAVGAQLTQDRFHQSNNAYSFNGIDDHIAIGNPPLLRITKAITLSVWVKSRTFWYNGILSKTAGSGGVGEGYRLQLTQSGTGKYFGASIAYPGFGPHGINSAAGVGYVENEWVNFTFTLEGQHAIYYKNGVKEFEIPTNHQPLTRATYGDFFIGTAPGLTPFDGSIDDVAIYDRVLSPYEVKQLSGMMED